MDEDEVTPLRQSDYDSAATSTGHSRPTLQFRTSSAIKKSQTEPPLQRERSRAYSRTSTSTDNMFLPRISEDPLNDPDEPTQQWHSLALAFVALPAFAGLFFDNGSAVMTDILMLGVGCLFLYWSVKWPWQWYYSTQELKLADVDPDAEYAVVEEDSEEYDEEKKEEEGEPLVEDKAPGSYPGRVTTRRAEARKSLEALEFTALLSCFISPMLVAFVLHNIRPYLSQPSGGLVSNSNLTLFVLSAEVRPILHFFRLVEERTLHLQRIVTSLPASEENKRMGQIEALAKRMEDLEKDLETKGALPLPREKEKGTASEPAIERNVRQSLQPQLDALNRAVRRYEKRAMTQAIVTEARLQDLETRLKDALSLAAAASRGHQQNGGLFDYIVSWISMLAMAPFDGMRALVLWPVRLASDVYIFLLGPRKKKRRHVKSSADSKDFRDFRGKARVEQR
ncbi:Long-chain-fatty-acid-CoA ligase 1 [Venturia nashicola]|nr:Long-chain-fatty-acid-CoA ligase 1 [Venturia nashicola]